MMGHWLASTLINLQLQYFLIYGSITISLLHTRDAETPQVSELKVHLCDQSSDMVLLGGVRRWWIAEEVPDWCDFAALREMDVQRGLTKSRSLNTLEITLVFLFVAMTGTCIGLVVIYFTDKADSTSYSQGEWQYVENAWNSGFTAHFKVAGVVVRCWSLEINKIMDITLLDFSCRICTQTFPRSDWHTGRPHMFRIFLVYLQYFELGKCVLSWSHWPFSTIRTQLNFQFSSFS